jgi:hypothetical protein
MPNESPKHVCFICSNAKDVTTFNPEKQRDDPVVSFFIGIPLCRHCVKILLSNCLVDEKIRITNPGVFRLFMRSLIADSFAQRNPSTLPGPIICEICLENEATKLDPKIDPNSIYKENYIEYLGKFYCEKCYDAAKSP